MTDERKPAGLVKVEDAAEAALNAQLPNGYQWGEDAMEQFNFGKQRAADAIRALPRTHAAGEAPDPAVVIRSVGAFLGGRRAPEWVIDAVYDFARNHPSYEPPARAALDKDSDQ